MGLVDQLLESLLQQQGARQPEQPPSAQAGGLSRAQLVGLVSAVVALLNDPRIGGIDGLVRRFQQAGLGQLIDSWVGTGANETIDPGQLGQVLADETSRMSEEVGVPPQQGRSILAQILPQMIDQLTPGGRVPQRDQLGQLASDLLKSLLR
jgi:uncharacterized protein YidB (DUF937 family)